MLCKKPFLPATGPAFGCGQCLPCRYNRRRIWSHRIVLESKLHKYSSFLTMTYGPDQMPANGSLEPRDLTLFIKRLRKRMEPYQLRYFAVGEYGDGTERPHYHAALFGYPGCRYGRSRYSAYTIDCCANCDTIRDIWGKGHILLGTLVHDSAQYLAGYVTKKMTSKDDIRLDNRHPEYARMSLKPGIGADAMFEVASVLLQYGLDEAADVPLALAHGRKELPLGRYLRRKLREAIGKDGQVSSEVLQSLGEEMSSLRKDYEASSYFREGKSLKQFMLDGEHGQKITNFEARQEIYKQQRGKI